MANENVTIGRSFPIGVSELYEAWTDDAALKQWWHPAGKELKSVEAEINVGGKIRYTFAEGEEGQGPLIIESTMKALL
jgi:uncharacterized protein YndB with AHSA1/START domain